MQRLSVLDCLQVWVHQLTRRSVEDGREILIKQLTLENDLQWSTFFILQNSIRGFPEVADAWMIICFDKTFCLTLDLQYSFIHSYHIWSKCL